jgi:hypothetical protein
MLGHGVYRKSTHTNRYMRSHIIIHVKNREFVLHLHSGHSVWQTKKKNITQELDQLKLAFKQKGYTDRHTTSYKIQWIIRSNNRRAKTQTCFLALNETHDGSYRATCGEERHQTGIYTLQKDCTNVKTKNATSEV